MKTKCRVQVPILRCFFLTSLSMSVLFAYTQMFNSRSPDLFYRNQTESRVPTCIIAMHSYTRFSWWVFCLQPSQIRYKSMQSVDGDSSQPICTKITLKKDQRNDLFHTAMMSHYFPSSKLAHES